MARRKSARKAAPAAKGGASAAMAVRTSPWILSPTLDSLLFIGAPLVVMAVFLPLRGVFTSEQIAIFLLAFFTFGHHLPGFLRAYGDKELFARYRWRFLLAPPLLFVTALWFDSKQLHGLLLFVAAWDIWHVLMQHYGFMRIYDSKAGAITATTSWLDWGFAICWYITLIVHSPHYRHNMLSRAYQSGLPVLPPGVVNGVVSGLTVLAALLSLAYVGYHLNLWRTGKPVSFRKLAMMGIFLAATYYLYVYIDDFLVGFTVWSAFHCIQYYGIVWAFNQNRVARQSPLTSFIKFLFRPRLGLVALYAGLILAYGGLNLLPGFAGNELLRRLLIAFIFTSNALHYYYDGFIWKVREPETRAYLDIASVGEAGKRGLAAAKASVSRAMKSLRPANNGALQAAYLGAIVVALAAFETWLPNADLPVTQSLAGAAPSVGEAHYNLGNALWRQGQLDDAISAYREATQRMTTSSKVYNNLGGALFDAGKVEEAIEAYRQALTFREQHDEQRHTTSGSPLMPGSAHSEEASLFVIHGNLADALARYGEPEEALEHYRLALASGPASDPRLAKIYAGHGATLAEVGRYEEGTQQLQHALSINPSYASAHINLGSVLAYLGKRAEARTHYQMALRSDDARARQAAQAALARLQSEQ